MPIDTPTSPVPGAPIADRAETAPPATPPAPALPLLTQDDLDDPERFVTIPGVPLVDAHPDPGKDLNGAERGELAPDRLYLLARNSNALAARGDFPALQLGHTKSKHTQEIEHESGVKVRLLGTDEPEQPPIVGYATRFRVGRFRGQPTLFTDWHIHREHYDEARRYPFRSMERIPDEEHIDRIALLKSRPERDLGIVRYDRGAAAPRRVCYSQRDFPPLDWGESEPEVAAPAPMPTTSSAPADASAPTPTPAPPVPAPDTSPNPTPSPSSSEDLSLMPLTPEDIEAIADRVYAKFSEAMPEADSNPDGGAHASPEDEAAHYDATNAALTDDGGDSEAGDGAMDEDTEPDRAMYADGGGEAGGDSTFVPGGDRPARKPAPACAARPDRAMYAKIEKLAQDQGETAEIVAFLFERNMALEHDQRRTLYGKRLDTIRDEGFSISDEARTLLLEQLTPTTPEGFEDAKEKEIRLLYASARTPVGSRQRVPVAAAPSASRRDAGPSQDDYKRATVLCTRTPGMTFADALQKVQGQ